MGRAHRVSEVLFEQYLDLHGYEWEHEPDWGVTTAPDYLVRRRGVEFICEVKEFDTQAIRELGEAAGGPVAVPPALQYRTIRNQLHAAAKQLRPLADRDVPLVILLSNPKRATVLLEPDTVFHSMYGDSRWVVPGDAAPSIDAWPGPTAAQRNGALTGSHAYISSVVMLRTRREGYSFDAPVLPGVPADQPYVHVIDTRGTDAVALPHGVFDAASDARWSPDAHSRWRQVSGLVRPGSVADPDWSLP